MSLRRTNYFFGKHSLEQLATCHVDLQTILRVSMSVSRVDFSIIEGHRSVSRQKELFADGYTKLDGVSRMSKHNHSPSLAVDICPFFEGELHWHAEHFIYLAGVIQGVGAYLQSMRKVSHSVRWGGNWDSDGIIMLDQTFQDLGHFELV